MAVKAAAAAPAYPKPARYGSKLTLTLADNVMVRVDMRMAPLVPSGNTGRLAAHTVCQEHLLPMYGDDKCPDCWTETKPTVMAYEWEERLVTADEIDTTSLGAVKDTELELKALVDPDQVDPLYFEKAYLIFPEAGKEVAFDQLVEGLRASGKLAVGTTVMNKATRIVVIRFSDLTGTLVAHQLTFGARVGWSDINAVAAGRDMRPQIDAKKAKQAAEWIAASLDDEFDLNSVVDEYAVGLEEAVKAVAAGKPQPERAVSTAPVAPVDDLFAALSASFDSKVKPAKKAASKPRAKKAA